MYFDKGKIINTDINFVTKRGEESNPNSINEGDIVIYRKDIVFYNLRILKKVGNNIKAEVIDIDWSISGGHC